MDDVEIQQAKRIDTLKNQFYLRATNSPGLFLIANFLMTNFLLLQKHSVLVLLIIGSYATVMACYTNKPILASLANNNNVAVNDESMSGIEYYFTTNEGLKHYLQFLILLAILHVVHMLMCGIANLVKGRSIKSKAELNKLYQ